MNSMQKDYYVSRSMKLVKELDERLRFFKSVLYRSFSNAEVSQITNLTLRHFMEMLPKLPYVGGDKNPLTPALIASCSFLALTQALEKYDRTEAEIRGIIKAISMEVARAETRTRRKRAIITSHRVFQPVKMLKNLMSQPQAPLPLHQEFLITFVGRSEPGDTSVEYSPYHGTIVRFWQAASTAPCRYTYRVNYWNGYFNSIDVVPQEVETEFDAVTA